MRLIAVAFAVQSMCLASPCLSIRYVPPDTLHTPTCDMVTDRASLISYLIQSEVRSDVAELRANTYLRGKSIADARNEMCEK